MSKKVKLSSTQEQIEVGEIREGIVIMRDGSLRMVLYASAINFALKSEQEQNAIIYQYQNFLNSLAFPIQILMQSRKIDLQPYLSTLKERLDYEENELLQVQIVDYIEFINRLIKIANIMDKKFYIVVPFSPPGLKKRTLIDKIFHPSRLTIAEITETEFKSYQQEMTERANVIASGLSALGIHSAVLNTQQAVELLYATYNPEEASKEKLTKIEDLSQPAIGKEAEQAIALSQARKASANEIGTNKSQDTSDKIQKIPNDQNTINK